MRPFRFFLIVLCKNHAISILSQEIHNYNKARRFFYKIKTSPKHKFKRCFWGDIYLNDTKIQAVNEGVISI